MLESACTLNLRYPLGVALVPLSATTAAPQRRASLSTWMLLLDHKPASPWRCRYLSYRCSSSVVVYSTSMLPLQPQSASRWPCCCLLWTVPHVSSQHSLLQIPVRVVPTIVVPGQWRITAPYSCYEQSHVHPLLSLRDSLLSDQGGAFSTSLLRPRSLQLVVGSLLRRSLLPARSLFPHLSTVHAQSQVYILVSLINFHSLHRVRPIPAQPINLALVGHPWITHTPHILQPPLAFHGKLNYANLLAAN